MNDPSGSVSRRRILHLCLGSAVASASISGARGRQAGASGTPDDPEPPYYGDWFRNVENYDGRTVDARGQDSATVIVGASGNGGPYAFDPPAIHVDVGAEIEFLWRDDTTAHNVTFENGMRSGRPFASPEQVGFVGEFDESGIYRYYCEPHRDRGMKGAVVVGSEYTTAEEGTTATWSFDPGQSLLASPTIVGGTVFTGIDHSVYAIDAASGEKRWRFQAEEGVLVAPAVADGTVFAASDDHVLYALAADTGEKRWEFEGLGVMRTSPAVANGTVFVGDTSLYAVDVATGERRWQFSEVDGMPTSPTVVAGVVYVGSYDDTLYAIDADSGDSLWQYSTADAIVAAPTVADGTVFVANEGWELHAVDAESGERRWRFETRTGVRSAPTVANGQVFVGTLSGAVHAVDVETGDGRWRFYADESVTSSPTVVDGTVIVGADDHHVYGIDASSGDQVWTFVASDRVRSSPTVVDGTAYVGSLDGTLYAIDARVDGSSAGSRVRLGTLGHHDDVRWSRSKTDTEERVVDGTPATFYEETDGGTSDSSGASGPGFGLAGAVAGALGMGYYLGRRSADWPFED